MAWPKHKDFQKVVFVARQFEGRAEVRNSSLRFVDLKSLAWRLRCGVWLLGAPEHGFDARGKFSRTKRLDYVVVGADLEAHDPINFIRARRQKNDRQRMSFADLFAQLHAVDVGESDVEDDKVDRVFFQQRANRRPRKSAKCFKAVGFQRVLNGLGNRRLIFDDENPCLLGLHVLSVAFAKPQIHHLWDQNNDRQNNQAPDDNHAGVFKEAITLGVQRAIEQRKRERNETIPKKRRPYRERRLGMIGFSSALRSLDERKNSMNYPIKQAQEKEINDYAFEMVHPCRRKPAAV